MTRCIFCEIVDGAVSATIVYEDDDALGFYPRATERLADGHVLVIPKQHAIDLFDAAPADLEAVIRAARHVADAQRAALAASGVNVLIASGPDSGQSVPHLHLHVVPRWSGDRLNTWPSGRSEHRMSGESATMLRAHFEREVGDLDIGATGSSSQGAELSESAIMADSRHGTGEVVPEAVDVLRRMVGMFSTGDMTELATSVSPDYVDHQGIGGTPVHGPTGFATVLAAARAPFLRLDVIVEDVVVDGDVATARLCWQGTRADGTYERRYTRDMIRAQAGLAVEHWGHPTR